MFTNGNSVPTTFAAFNGKAGAFVVNKNGEKQTFSQIRDARVTRASIKDDEFEGQPLKKLRLTLEDANGRAIVDFNMGMGVVAKMVGLLLKADLSAPLGLSAQLKKAGTTYTRKDGSVSEPLKSDLADISVYQGGYLQLGVDELPPKAEKVTVGKKEVSDTSARDEWTEARVAELIAKLNGGTPVSEEPHEESGLSATDLGGIHDDDIPF